LTGHELCAWIFANGELAEPDRLKTMLKPGDALFAADGGQRHLAKLSLLPERVIGDLDSIDPDELIRLTGVGVRVERYPVDKDETDLELAIRRAVHEGYRMLRIAGGLGGRLDQTLGNLFLLQQPELAGLDVRLEDGVEEVFLIRQQGEMNGAPGDTVSLLPLNGPAQGVTTVGLKYPLQHETLYPDKTRGISNVMLAEKAGITILSGLLICIHSRK
jgi:thiamine pyrophosphokinase